ncbi:MAG: UDP-N-acetylmuramyl-tripeptide synthetase [Myxococcales bacterium]|nr:UDP-N-acetylmuramyl-tripeptide synthetase [Myxococcales bacterium]
MSAPPPAAGPEDPRLIEARRRLVAACVTGTNGKTTTTSMIAAIVAAAGEPSARITTLGAWVDDEQVADGVSMDAFLAGLERALAAGVRTVAVETTSKSLASGFAWRWPARVAVFTNLSRDHLDYHRTPEEYLAAKAQLFLAQPPDGLAVFNAADPSSALIAELLPPGRRRVACTARGVHPDCAALPLALAADEVRVDREGTRLRLAPSDLADALGGALRLRVIGAVHAENALAAALAAHGLGYPPSAIRAGLERFPGVEGRFQVVLREPLAVVDYAHTPDALARTLDLARELADASGGRVWCVFGCGGDRDQGKRPQMGRIADERADEVVLTNDNPRGEDPERIADAIAAGVHAPRARWTRELDRAAAIALALRHARPADVVIVAGKGHERTQIVGPRTLPFSDVEEIRRVAGRATPRS